MPDQQRIAEIEKRLSQELQRSGFSRRSVRLIEKDIPFLLSVLAAKDAEIERLREAQRWIPVTERLPEHRRSVLAYCPEPNNIYCGDYHGKEDDVFRDTGKWYYFGQGLMREIDEEVTHWQPLPAAPDHVPAATKMIGDQP